VRIIPIDASRLKWLVVGEPTAQLRAGEPVLDRASGRAMWNLNVTVIGEGRAETVQLALPEGGFPKGLAIGTLIVPELAVAIPWLKENRHGVMVRADSSKVEGVQAGLKGAAA
jgi:hypothetical protein